jgi:E3 ubiquitin-protein ligase RNF5
MVIATEATASGSSSRERKDSNEEKEKDERMFECNICLDTAKEAVVSMCGHLFW